MSKQSEPKQTGRRQGFLSRFLRNRSGSTAVEFTLLAIPFAALVFAILETCISFAGQQVMSNATDDIARQMRTGQLKPGPALTETALKDNDLRPAGDHRLGRLPGRLEVDLQKYDTFALAAAVRIKFTDGDRDTTGSRYHRLQSRSRPLPVDKHAARLLQMACHHRLHVHARSPTN